MVKLLSVAILGFMVNIISNAVSQSDSVGELPGRLGWWTLLAPLGVTLIMLDFISDLRTQRGLSSATREAHRDSLARIVETNDRVSASLLQLLAKSFRKAGLNLHLFYREQVGDRTALVKDRRHVFESENLPVNHMLDMAYPDMDELVICEAFNRDEIIYEELPDTHPERYNERIKNKVDPKISWVLACPMHIERDRPAGIICAFGEKPVLRDTATRRHFQGLMSLAGDIIAAGRILAEQERLKTEK